MFKIYSDLEDGGDDPESKGSKIPRSEYPQIRIERRAMDQKRLKLERTNLMTELIEICCRFHDRLQFERLSQRPIRRVASKLIGIFKNFDPVSLIFRIFPIFAWLPEYKWKEDFVSDASAGFTVAVMHIPQGKQT